MCISMVTWYVKSTEKFPVLSEGRTKNHKMNVFLLRCCASQDIPSAICINPVPNLAQRGRGGGRSKIQKSTAKQIEAILAFTKEKKDVGSQNI